MDYIRITNIEDPLFKKMHDLMKEIFSSEEVLEFDLWKEPLEDPSIFVYVSVLENEVVGATEYRYYEDFNVAMTDFTIVGRDGLGVGPFLASKRLNHLQDLAAKNGQILQGMFAEIYNPGLVEELEFGGVKAMNPVVRREVLSHLGYKKINFSYVHPSWHNDGTAVTGLDLCFLPMNGEQEELDAKLVFEFLNRYYSVLPNKPQQWLDMVEQLKNKDKVELQAI